MPPKDKRQLPSQWSPEMLKELQEFIKSLLPMSVTILEKHKSTSFLNKHNPTSFGENRISHVFYRGVISVSEFEDISVVLNPVGNLTGEYKKYIGYIEIENNIREGPIPVPEIRGFIIGDSGIFESINEMLIESKIFNATVSPIYIYLEQSYCLKDESPEELLKKKIPIREISTYHKVCCFK